MKGVAIYLKFTKHWGICYHQESATKHTTLLDGCFTDQPLPLPANPSFPDQPIGSNPVCFVDTEYANDLLKRHSTIGYALIISGGTIARRSKTQSIAAQSSTEAEFYAAVSADKVCLFIRHVLNCLGHHPTGPTTIY